MTPGRGAGGGADAEGATDVDAISPVAQDHLKAIWSATEWGAPPTTTTALAARFGTSVANVSETMRRLAAQGLVDLVPYRPVTLTPRGEALAVAMVRRHRLVETYLVRMLGYGWDEVHDEAERLEHALSDRLVERMDAALGHPRADPHGDPIPDAEGRMPAPPDTVTLDAADPGRRWRIVRVSDADPGLLAVATALGLEPGAEIEGALRDRLPPGTAELVRVAPAR